MALRTQKISPMVDSDLPITATICTRSGCASAKLPAKADLRKCLLSMTRESLELHCQCHRRGNQFDRMKQKRSRISSPHGCSSTTTSA